MLSVETTVMVFSVGDRDWAQPQIQHGQVKFIPRIRMGIDGQKITKMK